MIISIFFDCDDDPSTQGELGLLHFHHHSTLDVQTRREECWAELVRDQMLLPADTIRLYDPDGKLMARLLYRDNEVMYQPCDPHSQADDSNHDESPPASCKDSQEKGTSTESDYTHQELPTCTVTPVPHLLPEASDLYVHVFSDPLPLVHNDQSPCTDDCASTPKQALSVCPTTPLDPTLPENTLSSSNTYSPTRVVLTTFDKHNSDFKTTLAASISRLLKDDANLLNEFATTSSVPHLRKLRKQERDIKT